MKDISNGKIIYNLVDRYEISISQCQMSIDLHFLIKCFLSSIIAKTFTGLYIRVTRRVFYKKQDLLTLREHLDSPEVLMVESVLLIFSVCPLRFPHKNDVRFVLTSSWLWGGGFCLMCCLCLFTYSGGKHILRGVFVLFFFVLCTLCCQFLWIVHF